MRMIVFFDLPVTTKKDRKAYTDFRKFLIRDGFIMLQYSVYSRTVRNHDDAHRHCRSVERNVPINGAVRVLTVTEKQYASMKLLAGERMKSENLLDNKELIEL
ncbi:MAG: CRISPR-associated endonuclease Cas2 [Ruminococcus sp.]|nr:CRISPR-associated endonuclease Cas2 [Ruminococcus sp.]